jgi:hypothetical protein
MIEINSPLIVAELQDLANRYEAALMSNDIPTLDAMFWRSPEVVRLGVGENLYGAEAIAAFRLTRPGGSPPRQVVKTAITAFGSDFGVVNLEFQRPGGGPIGRQSQTWVRLAEGWRIVCAHVSLMGAGH